MFVIRERIELRKCAGITINVPVVYMGQDEMIFMWATFILRALERVGPENQDFFCGPEMATSEASALWAQKVEIFRAHSFQWPEYWICPHQKSPSSRVFEPHIPPFDAGGGRTRWVERRWGVNILEDARHSSVLYICKYFAGLIDKVLH